MRANYIPVYCGNQGPLQALLVKQFIHADAKFVEVVITDRAHALDAAGRHKPKRVMAHVKHVAYSKRAVPDGVYAIFVIVK